MGKQRVEAWQIYQVLKQGEYTKCKECSDGWIDKGFLWIEKCPKCKGKGQIKTVWYNHPIVKMWKGYEQSLLRYGMAICEEWILRGYKDTLLDKFIKEYNIKKDIGNPLWLGNEKFHASHRSNLLRKDKNYYSKFGWKEKSNLPYYWIT